MRRQNISAENELELNIKFLTQFLIHPTKIGAVAPSNNKLCDLITDLADLPGKDILKASVKESASARPKQQRNNA